jgi:hypothetical protein
MLVEFTNTPLVKDFYLPDVLVKKLNISEFYSFGMLNDIPIVKCKINGVYKEMEFKTFPLSEE